MADVDPPHKSHSLYEKRTHIRLRFSKFTCNCTGQPPSIETGSREGRPLTHGLGRLDGVVSKTVVCEAMPFRKKRADEDCAMFRYVATHVLH